MRDTEQTTDVELDLTTPTDDGFELIFRTTESYLNDLCQQIKHNEIDGEYCLALEFKDVHPVAARVDNYLSGAEYDSIGVTSVGLDDPSHVNAKPITRTITPENAKSFVRSVSKLE